MRRLVECVPNFSEGRDRSVIDALADALRSTPGCALLDVDPGHSTHRTVYTFVGTPEAVVEGALAMARVAFERIDMRRHTGAHPRMGALDVCPFVPVSGVTIEECVACAREFGRRAAEELGIPVLLYERAATASHRTTLQQIRAGEYEGLERKLAQPEWRPDYGPAQFVPRWGATATGARFFLIAYNVNVLGTKEQAHRVALDVREQGRGPGQPGQLKAVKAIGWWVEEYGLAQVSMNLDDYRLTPPHAAYEACVASARRLNVAVAGSEIVGLVPRDALLTAAEHYIATENLFILDERQKLRLAIERLGLSSITPFVPEKRVIEYLVAEAPDEPLATLSLRAFVELLGSRTPAPGGGSAAALCAALGAALGAMVGWMTFGKRKFEDKQPILRRLIPPLDAAMRELVPMIDADTRAFDAYIAAQGLPKSTPAEEANRTQALQVALQRAVDVPLRTMRLVDACWPLLAELAEHGNWASRSDLEVSAKCLETGLWGAERNVAINLEGVLDPEFKAGVHAEAQALMARGQAGLARVLAVLASRQPTEQ